MRDRLNGFDVFVSILLIIGALHLGILGVFGYSVLGTIFGGFPVLLKVIYAAIGLSGLWLIYALVRCRKTCFNTKS